MKSKMKILFISSFFVSIFSFSCPLPNPSISVTPNPKIGDRVVLSVVHIAGATAHWTLPNGRESAGDSLVINSATSDNEGSYYVKYSNSECFSKEIVKNLFLGDCPNLNTPVISVVEPQVSIGGTIQLSVVNFANTTVLWKGPDTVFMGNTWKREKSTIKMYGQYSAYYQYIFQTSCKSPLAITTITAQTATRTIQTNYNGKNYFVDIVYSTSSAKIFLREDKLKQSAGDIAVAEIKIEQMPVERFKKTFFKFFDVLDKGNTLIGCTEAAGAVGCALGVAATEGVALPVCITLIRLGPVGIAQCLSGLAGEVASSLNQDGLWATANVGASISNQDLGGAVINLVKMAEIVDAKKTPTVQNGKVIEAPPAPNPSQSKPTQPNNPSRPDKPDRPGRPDKPDRPSRPDKPDRPIRPT